MLASRTLLTFVPQRCFARLDPHILYIIFTFHICPKGMFHLVYDCNDSLLVIYAHSARSNPGCLDDSPIERSPTEDYIKEDNLNIVAGAIAEFYNEIHEQVVGQWGVIISNNFVVNTHFPP